MLLFILSVFKCIKKIILLLNVRIMVAFREFSEMRVQSDYELKKMFISLERHYLVTSIFSRNENSERCTFVYIFQVLFMKREKKF